jgi:glycosyltransferase involved in cell wall biosynthesis
MKVFIANSLIPFIRQDSEIVTNSLYRELKKRKITCDFTHLPFSHIDDVIEQSVAVRLIDLTNYCDQLITIGAPSHLLPHPKKNIWFYSTYHSSLRTNSDSEINTSIKKSDALAFEESHNIFFPSKFNLSTKNGIPDIKKTLLYPPLDHAEKYEDKSFSDYILIPDYIAENKRQLLLLKALVKTKAPIKVIILGSILDKKYYEKINTFVQENKLQDRVTFIHTYSLKEEIELYANARAIAQLGVAEQSFGLNSMKALYSKKPVITTTDSESTQDLIQQKVSGFIVNPIPIQLAEILDTHIQSKDVVKKLGKTGYEKITNLNLNWNYTINSLLS